MNNVLDNLEPVKLRGNVLLIDLSVSGDGRNLLFRRAWRLPVNQIEVTDIRDRESVMQSHIVEVTDGVSRKTLKDSESRYSLPCDHYTESQWEDAYDALYSNIASARRHSRRDFLDDFKRAVHAAFTHGGTRTIMIAAAELSYFGPRADRRVTGQFDRAFTSLNIEGWDVELAAALHGDES